MAKMTKAQLIDENIALRTQCDVLERRIAALEEAEEADRPKDTARYIPVGVLIGSYTKRDGTVWNKFRTGVNQITHRPAPQQLGEES